ncbi:MAG: 3-oxoacid CoA-transferase subunit B [Candidatus Velamenicoccus archaeovorus]
MPWTDEQLAERIAQDIEPGWIINLGIGIPTLVAGYLHTPGVLVHAENGILGVGPRPAPGREDPDIIDPGKNPATVVPGAAFMDSLTSFGLIRGGHLDLAVVGAYQVSAGGDLANWRLPDRRVGGIGGAADLAAGARRIWVAMRYRAKDGSSKLVSECTYPLTAKGVVSRIYADLCVLHILPEGVQLVELAPGVEEEELRGITGVPLLARSPREPSVDVSRSS